MTGGRPSPRHRPRADESGASLLLILVFISTIGVLSAAIAGYELTITKQSFVVKRVQTREAAVNTALEWAVNSLRQGRDAFCQGADRHRVMSIGSREVRLTCQSAEPGQPGRSGQPGMDGFALFLNRSGPPDLNAVRTSGPIDAAGAAVIDGPVYNGAGAGGWQLATPLAVDGDVVVPGDCAPESVEALPKEVTATYEDARACTMGLGDLAAPVIPAPCASVCGAADPVSLDSAGVVTKDAPACKVFSPGWYTKAPVLAANNYFKPGVYAFDYPGEWRISAAVRGGDPAAATTTSQGEQVRTSVPRCTGAPVADEPNGVVFVLGGTASISVRDAGRMELFSHVVKGETLPSLAAGGIAGTSAFVPASTLSLAQDLLSTGDSGPELVLHSGVWAPDSGISLHAGPTAAEAIRNTVVVARLDLTAKDPPKAAGFGIRGRTGRVVRYLMMAESCPASASQPSPDACTTAQVAPLEPELCASATVTVYDDDRRTVWVENWRVDRDPGQSDPAHCAVPPNRAS